MRVSNRTIILLFIAVTLLLIPVAAFTSGAVRIILGLPVALFIPGYMLLAALFPNRDSLRPVSRIAFSLALSVAFCIITGVILSYIWSISLAPILTVFPVFIVITGAIAWCRARYSYDELDFTIDIDLYRWRQMAGADKALALLLAVALLATVGSVGYVLAVPKQDQQFSEFYILAIDGEAEEYPGQIAAGQALDITLGIINHEDKTMSYRVDVVIDGAVDRSIASDQIANDADWEVNASLALGSPGENRKVEFWLYKDGETEPYFEEPLFIHIDVTEN